MSKKIDERVVEMRFDNKQFEQNVSTTMSTIDKLKAKLKFDGTVNGLENVGKAVKNVDMSGLSTGVETVRMRFSALEVMAVTALANITNSAIAAGKNLISSFTIDPITDGFREYELQMNSVQTILANTASKGTTINDVTAALNELNDYADMTIYNFGEMTKNIGTFTAAGVDLDKSVAAIKGIANLGAMSGSTAAQVSTAMYQLSQALATGKVSLMDWNSVVNAGMGGEQFQNALKRTAEHFGSNVDGMIEKYGSFRESLTEGGWLTAEVLTETLNQISGAYTEADLIQQGYTESQAKAIVEMANTATDAATKVKTFTQLMDTLKEAAGSGWAQTWQIILGDFEEAKVFFTDLSDYLGDIIGGMSDARNEMLSGAFDSNWSKLAKEIEKAGVPLDTFQEKLTAVASQHGIDLDKMIEEQGSLEKAMQKIPKSGDLVRETLDGMAGSTDTLNKSTSAMNDKLEYFQKVVDEVWNGDYKNGQERVEALTKAGYDYAEVQDLVNKTVDGNRLTLDDLSTSQMKAIGYTDDQIKALQELSKQAKDSGSSLSELIDNLDKPSGRELFLETISNTLKAIIEPIRAVGRAFNEVFGLNSDQVYGMIESLHRFSEAILMNEDSLDKLTRTFKGVFSIVKIFTSLIGGGFGLAFNIATGVLENFNLGILDVTAFIGDVVTAFVDWITSGEVITSTIRGIGSVLKWAVGPIQGFIDGFLKLPAVESALNGISSFVSKIIDYFKELSDLNPSDALKNIVNDIKSYFANLSWEDALASFRRFGEQVREVFSEVVNQMIAVGPDILAGLQNGLSDGVDRVLEIMREIGTKIIEAIKAVLGIHSPSTEMYDVATNAIDGFVNGFKDGIARVITMLKDFGTRIIDTIKNIPWSSVLAAGVSVALVLIVKNLVGAISAIASPLEGLGDVLSGAGEILERAAKPIAKTIKSVANVINAKAFETRMDAISGLAKSLAILAGSLFLLAQVDTAKLWSSVGAIAALAAVIGVLSFALGKINANDSVNLSGFAITVVGISVAVLLMASAVKKLGSMDADSVGQALIGLVTIIGSLATILAAYGNLVKGEAAKNIGKLGIMMYQLSGSLLLMVVVIKLISGLSAGELLKGAAAITAFIGVVALLSLVSKLVGQNADKLGGMMLKLSVSLLLMVGVVKLISMLSVEELVKGGAAITAFILLVGLLVQITKIGPDKQIAKVGTTLLAMSASLLIMTGIVKLLAGMSVADIAKGLIALTAFSGVVAILVAITKLAGENAGKLSLTLLSMSVSIGILAGIAILLSLIDTAGMVKGITAVGILATIMSGMVVATKFAQNVTGTIVALTVAIGVMAASVAALSLIDPSRLAGATVALSVVMGMFALIVKSTGTINAGMGTLIVLTAAIAVLGTVLVALSTLPIESTLASSVSLSVLLLSMAAAMKILGSIKSVSLSAIGALAVLSLVVAGLAVLISLLKPLDLGSTLETVISLSTLLIAMSGVTAILAAVGKLGAGAALQGVLGFAGVVTVIGTLMAAIGALTTYFPQLEDFVGKGIGLLEDVAYGIGSFIGNIIGGFMSGVTAGLPDIGTNLSDFMTNLQPFIEGASSIDQSVVDSVSSLAKMILTLTGADIITAITSFFTGGSSFTNLADQLIPFGEAMAEFSETISGRIDSDAVNAAANAGLALSELSKNLPKSGGLMQGIFGESQDLTTFGDQLVAFGEAITDFSQTVSGNVDQASVEAAANAGMSIAELAKNLPKTGGFLQEFFGSQDLELFGTQLKAFGEAIVSFSQTVSGNVDQASVESAASAGMTIAELANNIPKQGGFLQDFFGEQDIGEFGEQLKAFGEAIVNFSQTVSGNVDADAIEASKNAAMSMTELANNLPRQGGFLQDFFGKQDVSTFGEQLKSFGESFAAYSQSMTNVDPDVVEKTTSAAESLVTLANNLKDDKLFSNETWIDEFGSQLESFGYGFSNYYNSIAGIDTSVVSAVTTEIRNLVDLANGMVDLDTSGMSGFSQALTTLANNGITGFIGAFTDSTSRATQAIVSMINAMISAANSRQSAITSTFTTIINNILTSINSRANNFNTAGQNLVTNFMNGARAKQSNTVSTFKSIIDEVLSMIRSRFPEFTQIGKDLITKIVEGVTANAANLPNAFSNATDSSISALNGYYNSFYNAGVYLVEGFGRGIDDNAWSVADKAARMARDAYDAAMRELDAHSPSRVFMKVGSYVALGFANGISDNSSAVESSVTSMADAAIENTKNAISKIADAINSDIDVQPTIRPVLDLTDVDEKAARLNTLFSRDQAVSVNSRMNALARGATIQNGDSDSVAASQPSYSFVQNNYSPKALSQIEIYRQTNNMFSSMVRRVRV